jgi:filamin
MQRESQKDRTILCKFDPTEPGDYRVEVKWAGELVPGSPFIVMIFDTQEELNRFLQVNNYFHFNLHKASTADLN